MSAAQAVPRPDSDVSDVSDEIVAVADSFVGLMRAFTRARAQFLADAAHNVEWTAHMILKCLAAEGRPTRAGAVAELLQADPSTVSRQVAALVKDGLIERQSDPADGRASLLALTPKADDVLGAHERVRNTHFAQMLADWNERDLRRFADLLRKFTDDFVTTKHQFLSGAAATQRPPAERNH